MTQPEQQDIFEDVLNLEERYFEEGYHLGVADGSESGRIEGRTFGLAKGFEKFLEMGKLHGIALLWETRLPSSASVEATHAVDATMSAIPQFIAHDRLKKHVERLAALTDPNDLSTGNNEDSVSECEDRLKDAKAKATLIAKIIGEDEDGAATVLDPIIKTSGKALRIKRKESRTTAKQAGEMEDFVAPPGVGVG